MNGLTRLQGFLTGVLALASFLPAADASHIHSITGDQAIERWFADEAWRAGGPRDAEVLSLYRDLIAEGNPCAVEAANLYSESLLLRGFLHAEVFEPLLPELEALDEENGDHLIAGFRESAVMARLSRAERQELYRVRIQGTPAVSQSAVEGLPELVWPTAAYDALAEGMDELVPVIEAALDSRAVDPEGRDTVEYLREVAIPLAKARLAGDWVRGYLRLLDVDPCAAAAESLASRRAREILFAFCVRGASEALPDLEKLWHRALAADLGDAAELPASHPRRVTGTLLKMSKCPDLAWLLRAIHALGARSFEEVVSRTVLISRPQIRRGLESSGYAPRKTAVAREQGRK